MPFLEHDALYRQYHFDEPWDGPRNRALLEQMPAVYSALGPDGDPASRTNTSYFVFTGEQAAMGSPFIPGAKNSEANFQQISDGTSNTILAVERKASVPWTKPEDIPFDPNGAVPELGGFWADGVNVLMCDGSVRGIKKQINPTMLKAMITRAGGEIINWNQ